jgi:hypothetical protein
LIKVAVDTGLPVTLSPKYWAEHMGMPYMQTDIRALEKVHDTGKKTSGLMNLSNGARSFMRYGYGDLLKKDRRYKVIYRIWPGTQRLLLWGDPLTMAAHARNFSFCDSAGVELMEPLSFKGRRGSGIAGDRCGYADASLRPKWDWEKYLYTLRVFGRLAYNPDAEPDTWRRYLSRSLGVPAVLSAEAALANATRILPIVLTVHAASAGNNNYWPEIYSNQSIVQEEGRGNREYGDTPSPRLFGYVSPLDPQIFLNCHEFAAEWLKGERSGNYTPMQAAAWLEGYAAAAVKHLAEAAVKIKDRNKAEFRRLSVDVTIQTALGRFYAAKFRSAVCYSLFEQSGDHSALEAALVNYRKARGYWAGMIGAAGVYKPDLTFGENTWLRGHWQDRLPAIDEDIDRMARKMETSAQKTDPSAQKIGPSVHPSVLENAITRLPHATLLCHHRPPPEFHAGQKVKIEVSLDKRPQSVRLYYRQVNQAERYETMEMQLQTPASGIVLFQTDIPGAYTDSPYGLQYYFAIGGEQGAFLYPGFDATLTNQPYFIVRQAST